MEDSPRSFPPGRRLPQWCSEELAGEAVREASSAGQADAHPPRDEKYRALRRVYLRRLRPAADSHCLPQVLDTDTGHRPLYSSVCSSLPGLKRTALPGGIATSAPVRGLRPIPVLRGRTLKMPKPLSSMRSPCERARFMLSKTVSTAISALVLVMPVLFTTSLMMSSLIKVSSFSGIRGFGTPRRGSAGAR